MKLLDLPKGHTCLIDEADWPAVRDLTLYVGQNGYVYYSIWKNGRSNPRTLHQLLLGRVAETHIDHINGDKTDNRRANLRITTFQINQVNRKKLNRNSTSGQRGVTVRRGAKNPYIAQIMVNRRMLYLGSFPTLEAAVRARQTAELQHYGELCPR